MSGFAYADPSPATLPDQTAQTAPAPPPAAAARNAATQNAATQNAGGLDEVVVTAEFKKENLQDTPLAISSFSGDNLEERNITSTTQLGAMVPNTVIEPLGAGWGATISSFVRGIGLADNSLSFEPGVPFYFDGVYNGRPQAAILDLLDLDNVEVLRGPQGTLFGKDAIGGAIVLNSKKPTGDGGGYVEATTGSYNRIGGRGSIDVPIVPDKLMMRVAFSVNNQEGYGDILDYTCATGKTISGGKGGSLAGVGPIAIGAQTLSGDGRDCVVGHEGGVDDKAGRVALRYVANDDLEFNVIGDYTRDDDEAPVSKYLLLQSMPPNALLALWNQQVAIPIFGVGLGNQFLTGGKFSNYETYSDPLTGLSYPNEDDTTHWGVSGTIDYQLGDIMHIKSITAFRRFANDYGRDSDGSPIPFNRTFDNVTHTQTSQELDLTGTAFGALDWATGVYWYDAKDTDQGITILAPFFPFAPISNQSFDEITDQSYAAFAHGEYHVTDELSIIAGLRYTLDQKDALVSSYACCGDFASPGVALKNGTPIIPPTRIHIGAIDWSPQVELKYQWTPELQTYALYSTGFRNGGFGPRPSDAWQVQSFQPEDLTNYEAGVKSEFFDHRLRLNADVFYEDYSNQQQGFNICQPTGTPGAPASAGCVSWFQTINVGEAHIWGIEGEITARPIEGALVQASVGYTNYFRVDPGTDPTDPSATPPCQYTQSGVTCYPPRTPELNFAIGAQYSIPLADEGSWGTLTPRLDWRWQSAVFFTDLYNVGQNAYSTLDARVTWDSPDGDWQVAAFGTNITNTYYYYGKLSLQTVLGFDQANPAPPAEWGLTVKRTFSVAPAAQAYAAPPPAPPVPAATPAPAPQPEAQREFQVFFDFDKSAITEAAAKVIQAAAEVVKSGGIAHITVTGHTDTVGTARYNQALSERRAASVKLQLVTDGVAGGEINTVGVGKSGLLVPTADGVREPQNRRAVIELQ